MTPQPEPFPKEPELSYDAVQAALQMSTGKIANEATGCGRAIVPASPAPTTAAAQTPLLSCTPSPTEIALVASDEASIPNSMLPCAGPQVAAVGSLIAGAASLAVARNQYECCQCHKTFPATDIIHKGNQVWCRKDNNTYNCLQARWQKIGNCGLGTRT